MSSRRRKPPLDAGLHEYVRWLSEEWEPGGSRLECASCTAESVDSARGWRAFHGTEDDDSTSVVVLCPGCAEEVGDG